MNKQALDELPLSISAYIADTSHLSTLQHGAYLLLLMTMRRAGGWILDDDRKLANIVKMTLAKWKKIAADIRPLLISEGGQLSQKRVLSDLEKQKVLSLKNACNGKTGGIAKALKNKEPSLASATISPEGRQNQSDSALTRSLREEDNKVKKVRAKRAQGELLPSDWMPKPSHFEKGVELGFGREQIMLFAEKMRNWAGANAHRAVARKSNWDQAFHNWIADRAERRQSASAIIQDGGSNGKTTSGLGGYSGLAARLRQTIADEERDFGVPAAGGEQEHRR